MLQQNEGSALIDHQETAKSLQANQANDAGQPSQVVGELSQEDVHDSSAEESNKNQFIKKKSTNRSRIDQRESNSQKQNQSHHSQKLKSE